MENVLLLIFCPIVVIQDIIMSFVFVYARKCVIPGSLCDPIKSKPQNARCFPIMDPTPSVINLSSLNGSHASMPHLGALMMIPIRHPLMMPATGRVMNQPQ